MVKTCKDCIYFEERFIPDSVLGRCTTRHKTVNKSGFVCGLYKKRGFFEGMKRRYANKFFKV